MSWEALLRGGWVMLPLAVFSILSLAIIVERTIALLSSHVLSKPLQQAIEENRDLDEIHLLMSEDKSLLGKFLAQIRSKQHESKEVLRELSQSYYKRIWQDLERNLEFLNIVATVSPLLGLLGTVLGMVRIFSALSQSGLGNPAILSGGISEALLTTISGLAIAVPALIFYTFFSKKIETYLVILEECGKLYLSRLTQSYHSFICSPRRVRRYRSSFY